MYDGSTVDVQFRAMSKREGLKTPRDVSPLLNASAKTQLVFFKNAVSEEPVFCIYKCQQYTVLYEKHKIDKFNTVKEQRWL